MVRIQQIEPGIHQSGFQRQRMDFGNSQSCGKSLTVEALVMLGRHGADHAGQTRDLTQNRLTEERMRGEIL